jgi:hypothetical protein
LYASTPSGVNVFPVTKFSSKNNLIFYAPFYVFF